MGIERITLNFDTDDGNSMMLCSILKEIKRGHRMEVIADNILTKLEEHNLLEKYADNPAAMARALVMLSENYRATKNSAFKMSFDDRTSTPTKIYEHNRTKGEAKRSVDEGHSENISISTNTATGDSAFKKLPDKHYSRMRKQTPRLAESERACKRKREMGAGRFSLPSGSV